jgi:hypothetical protein
MNEAMTAPTLGPSLLAVFAPLPDPRASQGRRHPLPAILTLAVLAMLCGARSLYAIFQWGRLQSPDTVRAMGFTRAQTPTVSTIHLVFKALDVAAFEAAVGRWATTHFGDRAGVVAIDGKGLRGIHGEQLPAVRLVAGLLVEPSLVLGQSGGRAGAR